LVGAALGLGADQVRGWSARERAVAAAAPSPRQLLVPVGELRDRIRAGEDPLGEAFGRIRTAESRRTLGQTYTPPPIVGSMVGWAAGRGQPERVVDPGTGSGRYLLAAGAAFPAAALVGTDIDPVATLMTRGNLAAAGLAGRAEVRLADYRRLALPPVPGSTLFLGNPPYVRHHQIEPAWKQWLGRRPARRGGAAPPPRRPPGR